MEHTLPISKEGQSHPKLRVKGLTVAFGAIEVVSQVDLNLYPGKIMAITGENGAGKSSLAKAIAGVYPVRSGSIEIEGIRATFNSPREALRHGIALIHQEPVVFPDLDVAENIFAGRYPRKSGLADRQHCLSEASRLLKELGSNIDPRARVDRLSVANRQSIELAGALSLGARVWIFDETTASLSAHEVAELFQTMRKLRDDGAAIAFVSHRLDEVFSICDEITVLRDGRNVATLSASEASREDVVRAMIGQDLVHLEVTRIQTDEVAMKVSGLAGKGLGPIDIELRKGEVLGIAGLAGAGRTELLSTLFGLRRATSGQVDVCGNRLSLGSVARSRRVGLAMVPEDRVADSLFMPHSVEFNATASDWSKFGRIGWISNRLANQFIRSAALDVDLRYREPQQSIFELSGGNQQKTVLARWLDARPKVLLLDEPTRGIDIGARSTVYRIIEVQVAKGTAVVMASSDLQELITYCDRIVVMREGSLVGELSGESKTEENILQLAAGGLSIG